MIAIKAKFINLIKNKKITVFLLFLILSFFILVLTKLSAQYTNTTVFEIDFKNAKEEEIILNNDNQKLKLVLKTNGFRWLKFYLTKPKLIIDLITDTKKTDSTYVWTSNLGFSTIKSQFSKAVDIVSISPEEIHFKYDLNAVKMLPVKPNVDIQFKAGFDILKPIKVIPDSVKVIGPEGLLNTLKYIETKPLVLDDVNTSIYEELALNLDSLNTQIQINKDAIIIHAEVEKFTEGTVTVPIQLINVPKEINIKPFPKQVSITYYTSLKQFSKIKASDFKVVCDYQALTNTSTYLFPYIDKQPDAVKNSRLHQQKIEYIITK